jgi:hypothetical protein
MIGAVLRALPVMAALAVSIGGDGMASNRMASSRMASTGTASTGTEAPTPRWTEVKWPFPVDQWGAGRAFQCLADACGVTVMIYLRPKIGFCNCGKGVYDDGELDRVGDVGLLGPQYAGLGEGREVAVGWMKGRSRAFTVSGPYRAPAAAAAIAFNDKCDVVVATVTADADLPRAARQAVEFLNTEVVLRWARAELGSDGS